MPYNYNEINTATASYAPSTTHVSDTTIADYFRRYLFMKAITVFKWTLPERWDKNYFLYTLYRDGFIAVLDTPEFGVIPQQCGLMSYNVFYQPAKVTVANPLINGLVQRTINLDCVLFRLTPDYRGIMDLVEFYVDKLSLMAETMSIDLQNSKLSYVFGASSKQGAESLKKMYDSIQSGDPAVFVDKNLFNADGTPSWQMFSQNLKENYIVSSLLDDMRKLEEQFLTQIGINNANTDKRERLIVDEVNANNEETHTLCDMWLESLQSACAKTKAMFGIDITVDWRNKPNDKSNTVNTGAV